MARRRKGKEVHGWLVIDKPIGITSTQAVGRARRVFDPKKIGHGGTLDPLATGLLPIAMGEATKTVSYVMDGSKTYRFTLRWGQATATDDAEGEITETSDVRPDRSEVVAALTDFVGLIEQVPPKYSAIKIDGKRAYDRARRDEIFTLQPRQVRIDRFDLVSQDGPDLATFAVDCGKGTYMRALARDLALALGTVAHIADLRRTAVGYFTEKHAISLETLESLGHSAAALGHLHPVETALDDIPALVLTESEASRLRSGQPVSFLARHNHVRIQDLTQGTTVCAMTDGKPVALARYEAGALRPVRVLNL